MSNLVNPRLVDVFGLDLCQEDVEFAIPRIQEDIPLYFDPFLLWNSEKPEYQELHDNLLDFLHYVRQCVVGDRIEEAASLLAATREPCELGLGYAAASKAGSNIGPKLIGSILSALSSVPQLHRGEMRHIEELQLIVPGIAEDRLSDTAACVLLPFFVEFTRSQAALHSMPTRKARIGIMYSKLKQTWVESPEVFLPYNPNDDSPILFAPLDLLRRLPWINYDDYYRSAYAPRILPSTQRQRRVAKQAVQEFNSRNYREVQRYVAEKEATADLCLADPLFRTLSTGTLKTKFRALRALPTGSQDGADRKYEDLIHSLLSSLLFPSLEFAEARSRTISGGHIRDLIFYNDGKTTFLKDLRDRFSARQPVFELKNVRAVSPEHINQLYRYLDEEFGNFGVLVTRNPIPKAVIRNIVDLHSSKRYVILWLTDQDIELMLALREGQRDPTDALKKRYVEFTRLLPK